MNPKTNLHHKAMRRKATPANLHNGFEMTQNPLVQEKCADKNQKKKPQLAPLHLILIVVIGYFSLGMSSCEQLVQIPMTETEVAMGLREALTVGITNAVMQTSKENGYFENAAIKIPFPPEASGAMQFMQNSQLLRPLLNDFVVKLNRAAEDASVEARPIFIDAIRNITITDAWNILRGGNNAATEYLKQQTYDQLYQAFRPQILASLNEVGAQTVWSELSTTYNAIATFTPNLSRVNTDLAHYATTEALNGLFTVVALEEQKIRQDPAARVTDLLKRVFARQ